MTWRGASVPLVVLTTFAAAGSATRALSFPGSVRWGYANCATCHYSVAGGGLLTPYGRQLSRELLSTWGSEREAEFAYGSRLPRWLALGGDVEYLAASHGSPAGVRLVQADLEAAVIHDRWLAVATVGRGTSRPDFTGNDWISRRHYLQFAATPTVSFRAGRFLPNHGVWNGDGWVAVRRGLAWADDTYNVEGNWITDRFNLALTGIVGGTGETMMERGVSVSGGVFFGGKDKVWFSVLSRGRPGLHRRAAGLSGVFGIGRHAYVLSQTELQRMRMATPASAAPLDLLANLCFARETVKGLYVLLTDETVRRDLGSTGRWSHTYGAGLRWFPRPHLELQLRWRRRDPEAVSPEFLDGISGFVHFYP